MIGVKTFIPILFFNKTRVFYFNVFYLDKVFIYDEPWQQKKRLDSGHINNSNGKALR